MNFLAGILDFAANEKDFHPAKFWALELIESIDFPQNLTISAIPHLLKTLWNGQKKYCDLAAELWVRSCQDNINDETCELLEPYLRYDEDHFFCLYHSLLKELSGQVVIGTEMGKVVNIPTWVLSPHFPEMCLDISNT